MFFCPMLFSGLFPVFRRRNARFFFEAGAKAALAGKACAETDMLNGSVGGTKQKFGVADTGGDNIIVGRKPGFLFKQPAEIKRAKRGLGGQLVQREWVCQMLVDIGDAVGNEIGGNHAGVCRLLADQQFR